MNFYNFIIWSLLCYSISFIVTNSSLFQPLRGKIDKLSPFLGDLVTCPMCFGFWVGIFLNLSLYPITTNFFFDGCLGAGVSWLIYKWSSRPSW